MINLDNLVAAIHEGDKYAHVIIKNKEIDSVQFGKVNVPMLVVESYNAEANETYATLVISIDTSATTILNNLGLTTREQLYSVRIKLDKVLQKSDTIFKDSSGDDINTEVIKVLAEYQWLLTLKVVQYYD